MGGAVSSGESNDELVDNLLEADYIKSPQIERVFRAVDRASYYTEQHKMNAYKDLAWKEGNLHLSAPCIYSEVLENLDLRSGMNFLNIGSGTGYFSTVCGLLLGRTGVNHGIELYPDVVDYAQLKLSEFEKTSPSLDEFDFCSPVFTIGNFLETISVMNRYDRIYCGAACPVDYLPIIIDMLKIGGICVVPVGDSLIHITRVDGEKNNRRILLPVSFASLVSPNDGAPKSLVDLQWSPKTLTELCRSEIRATLRQTISYPDNKHFMEEFTKKKLKRRQERRRAKRLVVVQRRRSGNADDANGFVAIAYSMGSNNSSDEGQNRNRALHLEINAGQNRDRELNLDDHAGFSSSSSSGTSSEDSADEMLELAAGINREELQREDVVMDNGEEEDEDEGSEKSEPNVVNQVDAASGNSTPMADAEDEVVVVAGSGSCPFLSRNCSGTNGIARRTDRRNISALTSRASGTRSNQPSRVSRNHTSAESLLGRIRNLVRARQIDLESMRRQLQRNSDSDNSRSRSTSTREDENDNAQDGEEEILYSDVPTSDSSSSMSSASEDEASTEDQPSKSKKRCTNESGSGNLDNATEPKPDPLTSHPCSVQMAKKILDLPLPPPLKTYLNYNRKLNN